MFFPIAYNCEVIPGTLKQIDAGLGVVGGVNEDNEVFLFLGTRFERISSSLKHFTVGPAGELGANSSNNVFKFVDGSFKQIPSKNCCMCAKFILLYIYAFKLLYLQSILMPTDHLRYTFSQSFVILRKSN